MKLNIRLFAGARELAGREYVELEFPDAPCVGDVRRVLAETCPGLIPLTPNLLFAINAEYCRDADPVPENAEVVCFPPVSGG